MKVAIVASAIAFASAALALPQPQPREQQKGLTWTGPITKGGENVTITGSFKSVYEEIYKRNAKFDEELGNDNAARLNDIINPINWDSLECGYPDDGGEIADVGDSINRIRRMGGSCGFGDVDYNEWTGVKWDSDGGVAIGNLQRTHMVVANCQDIADNAEGIMQKCQGTAWRGVFTKWVPVTSGKIKSFDGTWGVRNLEMGCLEDGC